MQLAHQTAKYFQHELVSVNRQVIDGIEVYVGCYIEEVHLGQTALLPLCRFEVASNRTGVSFLERKESLQTPFLQNDVVTLLSL